MDVNELRALENKYKDLVSKINDVQMCMIDLMCKTNEEIKTIESQPDLYDRKYLRFTIGDNDFMGSTTQAMGRLIRDIIQSENEFDISNLEYISFIINSIWVNIYKLDRYINYHDISEDTGLDDYLKPNLSIVSYDEMIKEDWENHEVMYIPINFDGDINIK